MNNISKWIRRSVTACHNIHDSVRRVDEFFKPLRDPEALGANANANANAIDAPTPKPIETKENFFCGVGHAKNKPLVDALDAMCAAQHARGEDPNRTSRLLQGVGVDSRVTGGGDERRQDCKIRFR